MAKINIKDAGKFTSVGTSEYFTLKDDGDIAQVRMLYDDPDGGDMDFFLIHQIETEINGRKVRKYVSCNAVDEDGHIHKDDCPLCKAGYRTQEKLFLQLYDETDGKLKVWERGKNFVGKIVSFLNRYGSLVERPIEIERKGKKGDTNTTYEMFALEKDDKCLDDFPEKVNIEGTYVVKASKADMIDMVDGIYDWGGGKSHNDNEPTPTRREDSPRRESRRRRVVDDEF